MSAVAHNRKGHPTLPHHVFFLQAWHHMVFLHMCVLAARTFRGAAVHMATLTSLQCTGGGECKGTLHAKTIGDRFTQATMKVETGPLSSDSYMMLLEVTLSL